MKFFMYVPGMPFDGESVKAGKSLGGSESSGYFVARELQRKGHNVSVFCNAEQASKTDGVTYIPIGALNEQTPLGENFEKYSQVPHDVMIAQRVPGVFSRSFNSKLNYWWTHDLALKRSFKAITAMIWNIDRVLAVSDWHSKQVKDVYQIDDNFVSTFRNGVDLSNYAKFKTDPIEKIKSKTLLYTSRPERGLEQLVREGGIMDQLLKVDPEIRLIVAGYDNTTPDAADLYNYLFHRCEVLPNVINYGHLSKEALAKLQCEAWLHVYPTKFEETSCITAMEVQAAGTPIIHTDIGALCETLDGGGHIVCKAEDMVKKIAGLKDGDWTQLHYKALNKASEYEYTNSVSSLLEMIESDFKRATADKKAVYHHLVYHSDVMLANEYNAKHELGFDSIDIATDQKGFYEDVTAYHVKINNSHHLGHFGPILRMGRVQPIIKELQKLKDGSTVLDYGCCIGQLTYAFASLFPKLKFTGVDISQGNIDQALDFKADITPQFTSVSGPKDILNKYDMVIASEVLEHVPDYKQFLLDIETTVKEGGRIMMSTPAGAVEAGRFNLNLPIEHLHHFEEDDIRDLVSKKDDTSIIYVHDLDTIRGDKQGNYCWSWNKKKGTEFGSVDKARKFAIQNTRQRVSCCMIVKTGSETLSNTLSKVLHLTDEIIIGVDGNPTTGMLDTLERFHCNWFLIDSPLNIGFDAARNLTLEKATGEWILWIDDDEVWNWPERTNKFLRYNQFDSYAIAQHHFTAEPPSLMKTDFPARLFRNSGNIKFYGLVHEHPEFGMNEGIGKTFMLPSAEGSICHNGYDTEDTRRKRFQRNYPLMIKDREVYPNRLLGKFLWVRDLAHANRFEFEKTKQISEKMIKQAQEAVELWRGLVKDAPARLMIDSLQYLSESVDLLDPNGGLSFKMAVDFQHAGKKSDGQLVEGKVLNREDFTALSNRLMDEKLDPLLESNKYI